MPGIIRNRLPGAGQDENIVANIKRLVKDWVSKPNTIILGVSRGDMPLEDSAAIELSKEVDPNGERTIGVLTKIDV